VKSQKGVSLVNVIIYVFSMLIAISTVMLLNSFFFENILEMRGTGEIINQNNKFNMFFIQDVKECYNYSIGDSMESDDSGSSDTIQFIKNINSEEYIKYSLVNNQIYRDNVKIAENVDTLKFREVELDNGKKVIEVFIKLSYESNEKAYTTVYYPGRGY